MLATNTPDVLTDAVADLGAHAVVTPDDSAEGGPYDVLLELNAAPDPNAPDRVQIMTMHKSKGLEFDNVILPCLSTKPRAGNSPLLRWSEMEDLVIGTIRETGADRDAVYDYLGLHERRKADHEVGRLLYVAATRAKKRLHLFGEKDEKGSAYEQVRQLHLAQD